MQKDHRLIVDAFAEIRSPIEPWIDEVFYDFSQVHIQPGSIYVIGRQQLLDNMSKVRDACDGEGVIMIFNNSAEGSWTIDSQLSQLKLQELVKAGRLLIISGAAFSPEIPCLTHEHLLTKIMDFEETVHAQSHTDEIFGIKNKPYKFLFLNGRARPHRKYLYERFRQLDLLDQSLWTMLDSKPCVTRTFSLHKGEINLMATLSELRRLPDRYEVDRYRDPVFGPIIPDNTFLKQELFRREWGEIYLYHPPYLDTYFSLVTETVCSESDISFRTEKIAKPLAMGHPFLVAGTQGYLRDLRNLGFRTFGHVIDESYDQIDDSQRRMDRLVQIVQDLCSQDLASFLDQCRDICKYNQQHLFAFTQQHRKELASRFFQFIDSHARS